MYGITPSYFSLSYSSCNCFTEDCILTALPREHIILCAIQSKDAFFFKLLSVSCALSSTTGQSYIEDSYGLHTGANFIAAIEDSDDERFMKFAEVKIGFRPLLELIYYAQIWGNSASGNSCFARQSFDCSLAVVCDGVHGETNSILRLWPQFMKEANTISSTLNFSNKLMSTRCKVTYFLFPRLLYFVIISAPVASKFFKHKVLEQCRVFSSSIRNIFIWLQIYRSFVFVDRTYL